STLRFVTRVVFSSNMATDMFGDEARRIEESFCFLYLAKNDLRDARASLEAAGSQEHRAVATSLIRDAVVCYARPFIRCKGETAVHELKVKWVPLEKRELHRDVMRMR